jgi:hypothetical protein
VISDKPDKPDKPGNSQKAKRPPRYSVSVSAKTYARLNAVVDGSVAGFVDRIVSTALGSPVILARLVARCPPRAPDADL